MNIFLKGVSLSVVLSLALAPFSSQAWFFTSASAQSNADGFSVSGKNTQDIPLLASAVGMTSNLRPDDGVDITIADDSVLVAEIGARGTLADLVDIPINDTISVYIVQPGDTVAKVAAKFGVSEQTIRWANNMSKTAVLHRGEKLTILPITGVKHTVVSGNTIDTIAKKYKADAREIADYNNLELGDALQVGQVIIIPDGELDIVQKIVDPKTGKTSTVAVSKPKSGVVPTKGYYIRPVNGIKTQGFHTKYEAVDVGAPEGTPIVAMADGTVIVVKSPQSYNGGYGGLTIIQHGNGSQTLYAHQSKIDVSVGDRVTQGQKIGEVGHTGKVSGPTGNHLHYEIRGVNPTPRLY